MKEFFGYGRTRSGCDKGDIVTRHFNDYVNCIHTLVGGGWKTMEVLVAEFDMSEIKYIGQMSSSQNSRVIDNTTSYRIRKLTPRECFRLMGVTEADIDKIQQSGVSQSQQYKMAGNSIVVDVLEHIFRKMFVDTGQESQQLSLF
jgi:site-specific DNA-cytosine methylase